MAKSKNYQPRCKPRQERAKFTVQSILIATKEFLSSFTLNESNINAIAKRAGVAIGSLYYYFPNKESLASALIEKEIKKNFEIIGKRLEEIQSCNIHYGFQESAKILVDRYVRRRRYLQNLFIHIPSVGKMMLFLQSRTWFSDIIAKEWEKRKEDLQVEDINKAAFMVVQSITGVIQAFIHSEEIPFSEDELVYEIANLLSTYLTLTRQPLGTLNPDGSILKEVLDPEAPITP